MNQQWGLLAGPFTPATLLLLAGRAEALRCDKWRCHDAVHAQIARTPQADPEQILQLAVAEEAGLPTCVPARLLDKRRMPPKQNREFPSLLPDRIRHDLLPFANHALRCAVWMEENAVHTAPVVGPFGPLPFHKGDAIEIARGTVFYSTDPAVPAEGQEIKRRTRVAVHRVSNGYIDYRERHRVVSPEVFWAGSGGYWRWTDVLNASTPL